MGGGWNLNLMIVINKMSVNNQDYIMTHPERNLNVWPKFHGNPFNRCILDISSGPTDQIIKMFFKRVITCWILKAFRQNKTVTYFNQNLKGSNIHRIVSVKEDWIHSFLPQHNNHFLCLQWLIFQCCVVGVYKLPCWQHKHRYQRITCRF